ncbi:MAG: amino acid adenylation domain-containing protein, partial [Chloroflexaceae bacterium]|nr:amino acid adenylation domain-containing protein [Chloroflexaceae bacterium]
MNSEVATIAPPSVFGLSTSKEKQHHSHWEQQLRHAPATLDLRLDHTTPLPPCGRRERYDVTLPAELVAGLLALSKAEHVTPLVTLFAAATALLARYSGSSHFSLGYPHIDHNNSLQGVTYRLLHADLHGAPSFRTLLNRSSAMLAQARGHVPIPAAHLAALLNPQHDDAVCSFFRFLFAYAGCSDAQLDATRWLHTGGLADTTADLALVFQQDGGQLTATFSYSADRFAATTIERMAHNFVTLLEAALAHPDTSVFRLPLLHPAEQAQLASWGRNDVPFQLACLHQLIGMQAARTPQALALLFDGGQQSYAELEAEANQLAHYLRQHGVGPNRIVAVCMGRGKNLIRALLAILKAGGAYLPLDPIYPAVRLADMIEDAEPVALLSDGSLPAELLEHWNHTPPLPVLDLHADAANIRRQPTAPPAELASLDSLAYIIYTSGSTGKPKGVLVEHRSVASFVLGGGQVYQFTAADRGLHFSSVSFDASVEEMFIPLVHGAALVVTEGYSPPDFAQLQAAIVRHGITSVALPTAYWHTWISELSDGHGTVPPSVRQVIIGGEAASGERYNRWRTLVPSTVRLVNGYGPTEATVASIWYSPSPLADEPSGPLPIGRPYPNQHIYLLDAEQRPVPIGVQGELYLGGAGLARGYHNRPELTAERFVMVEGLAPDGPVRLYRTGDLARWRDDGMLLYEGRADQQVKVRGYRIEPSEIEATMRRHGAVQAAVVTTQPNNAGELG